MLRSLLCFFAILICSSAVQAQDFNWDEYEKWPYDAGTETTDANEATNLGKVIKDDAVKPSDGALSEIQKSFQVDYQTTKGVDQTATYFVKNILNWLLSIAGLVALIVLLYGFYQMFVAKDHKSGYEEAFKIVKGAAIALLIIAVARFIVSWFFEIYFRVKDDV
jgi:hypothetical protein